MLKIGFDFKLVDLIMRCIFTTFYKVCMNSLSALMHLARDDGLIKGVMVCRRSPQIAHILFADDCMLFGDYSIDGANILKKYSNGV
ncbi:reverse transcriptase [Gossypium australe]|uniref:Reverse transcriptase n=1 Tax=Gossypium australe TaxID=47621 RepID=A0A5B6VPF0_9ROSI|nr:reverse transcriptase [Gossypium australe]